MVQGQKQFADGGVLSFVYTGEGNSSISLTAEENDDIDRTIILNIKTISGLPERSEELIVHQIGLRELLQDINNNTIETADNKFLKSLKE